MHWLVALLFQLSVPLCISILNIPCSHVHRLDTPSPVVLHTRLNHGVIWQLRFCLPLPPLPLPGAHASNLPMYHPQHIPMYYRAAFVLAFQEHLHPTPAGFVSTRTFRFIWPTQRAAFLARAVPCICVRTKWHCICRFASAVELWRRCAEQKGPHGPCNTSEHLACRVSALQTLALVYTILLFVLMSCDLHAPSNLRRLHWEPRPMLLLAAQVPTYAMQPAAGLAFLARSTSPEPSFTSTTTTTTTTIIKYKLQVSTV